MWFYLVQKGWSWDNTGILEMPENTWGYLNIFVDTPWWDIMVDTSNVFKCQVFTAFTSLVKTLGIGYLDIPGMWFASEGYMLPRGQRDAYRIVTRSWWLISNELKLNRITLSTYLILSVCLLILNWPHIALMLNIPMIVSRPGWAKKHEAVPTGRASGIVSSKTVLKNVDYPKNPVNRIRNFWRNLFLFCGIGQEILTGNSGNPNFDGSWTILKRHGFWMVLSVMPAAHVDRMDLRAWQYIVYWN